MKSWTREELRKLGGKLPKVDLATCEGVMTALENYIQSTQTLDVPGAAALLGTVGKRTVAAGPAARLLHLLAANGAVDGSWGTVLERLLTSECDV